MRVLVAAASKHGATAEIGEAIADELRASGLEAECHLPDKVTTLDGYDAFVVGSGTYYGHWLGEAKELIERIAADSQERPVYVFSSGPIGDPPKPDEEPADVAKVVETAHARDHVLFPGKIVRKELGPVEKFFMSAFHLKDGDGRDWDEIRAWARHVAGDLRA